MEKLKAAQELIDFAKASMVQTGYSGEYISSFSSTWNALTLYLSNNYTLHYSPAIGITFLQERYGILTDCTYRKLTQVDKRRKKAIQILNNCLEHETFTAPKTHSLCKFSPDCEQAFQDFVQMRTNGGFSLSTINRDIACLNKLSDYLCSLNIYLHNLESTHIIGFMKKISASGKLPTLDGIASTLRLVLKFLYNEHYVSKDLVSFVPNVKRKPDGIPSTYTEAEIRQMLEHVDRAGPTGKRNYALIMLAAKLGMRASDICALTFENLKWQTNTIEFVVKKTGVSAILPLLNEVGEAIIDYIKYGRPDSEENHVFLRLQIPYVAMQPSNLYAIVSAALRNANIKLLPGKRQGPHALRASLASAMLDNNTPLPIISEALTHKNSDTTLNYLKIDLKHLREYSLEVPPLGNVWLGGGLR